MELMIRPDGNYLVPKDWNIRGFVLCLPGTTKSGFQGLGTLSRTPDSLVLASPMGIEAHVPLWGIDDVSVITFTGIMIERNTSVGPMLSPLPYPHGIEVIYSMETRIKLRLRLVTLSANAAHSWSSDIRSACQQIQLGILTEMMPQKRTLDR